MAENFRVIIPSAKLVPEELQKLGKLPAIIYPINQRIAFDYIYDQYKNLHTKVDINYMFQLFARVQEYYERKLTVVIPSILCAVLNLILNYIFIKLCGYQAAAYTTFFCYALFCFIHYLFYKKVCTEVLNGTQLYDVKGLLAISIGVVLSGVVITFINKLLWLKYTILIVAFVVLIIYRKRVYRVIRSVLGK